ncbi:MAG: AI-2E family transporter [Chloroflexi bacterium]|nr:AI-2E family transporter [Chloroflexota bacterium]
MSEVNNESTVETVSPQWPVWQKQLAGLVLIVSIPLIFLFFRPVFFTLLYVLLLAYVLRFPINLLHQRLKLKYGLSVFLVFFLFLLLAFVLFVTMAGAVLSTAVDLLRSLQEFLNGLLPAAEDVSLNVGRFDLGFLIEPLAGIAQKWVVTSIFGGPKEIISGFTQLLSNAASFMADFALLVTILLFFLLELPRTMTAFGKIFTQESRREYAILLQRSDDLFKNFLFGSLLVVGFYWLLATVLFYVTGVPNAFISGFIVGLPNFIPQLGGYVSTILVFIIALIGGSSRFTMNTLIFAFIDMVIFMVASGVAYYFVDARVYSKSVRIPIWLILVGLIPFAFFLGIAGFLIAAAAIAIFAEWVRFTLKKLRNEDPYPGEPEPPLFTKYWDEDLPELEPDTAH